MIFFCLFGVFGPTRKTTWDINMTGERLQILTNARHLSSEGFLRAISTVTTGHSFMIIISENPWHSHILPNIWQWSCHLLRAYKKICLFVCLFVVCWEFSSHSRIFQTYGDVTITGERFVISNFELCSALMAIEKWGFFSVPHLLWHGPSVYNGHLQGTGTLTHTRICQGRL